MSEGGPGRARGRAVSSRGRATRGAPVPAGAARPPSEPQVQQSGPPPVGAWAPKPAQQQARPLPVTARGKQAAQHQGPSTSEAGLAPGVQEVSGAFRGLQIAHGDEGQSSQRRGAMRGRTEFFAPMLTKPDSCKVKQGFGGAPLRVISNHFKLVKTTDWSLYQYRVDFSPDEERIKIKKALLRVHREVIGDAYMFDGTMLFCVKKLTTPQNNELELFSTRDADQQTIRIQIKFSNELVLGDYKYIQLYNIILRNCIDAMDFQLVGREYFDPRQSEEIRNFRLEIWPGYITSILQYENNIMLNLDVSHKVLRKDTVLELLIECKKRYREDWKDKFVNSILGTVVFTHYNNKPYRVDDVDFDSTPLSSFMKKDTEIKYINYYREKYQIDIRDKQQPLLISQPKAKDLRGGRNQNIVLIPELCNMTGLSNEMRSNFQLMKAVADKTRIPPGERIKAYYQFLKRMNSNPAVKKIQEQWNLKFADRLEEFSGRRFEPEKLVMGNGREISDEMGDWSRTMRGGDMLLSIKLVDWALIVPGYLLNDRGAKVDHYLGELRKASQSLRFELAAPQKIIAESDNPRAYHTAIEKALSKSNLQLVMCIVPNNRTDIYSSIKKKCCIDRPVASQVIAVKTLTHKNLLSVATKIAIQMNCKLGGAPWYVPIPFRDAEKKPDPTMIVGFDVCHDTGMKGRAFGALVASLDYHFTKFYSAVSQHDFGEELSNDIATHLTHAVMKFKNINGKLPSRILLYRDGVGESNVPFVLTHEVQMIKSKLNDVFPSVDFKLAVIIVSKRIQTRLFVDNENPKPGTVVDDVITQPVKYDFFLVSQSVRQGTITPTSYNVIYDTTGLKPDFMQRITYKMTHMYYNCSATVRVPAQVQYAHKLAFLVGQAIHQCPSTDLNGVLYFL